MKLLTVIVLLPLAGFLLNGLLGKRLGRTFVSVVGCGLPILAFLATLRAFAYLQGSGPEASLVEHSYQWATFGELAFDISFYFDRLAAVMALIITGVGSLIHIYSTGYMKDDPSYARYFAYLNLFLFFMLTLVLGRSLLVCFVGWEGVGLASYLLIGFWFEDPAKAAAGKKAFITNRIGDAGFLLGLFLLWHTLGTLNMDEINAAFSAPVLPAVSASLVGVLLFIGATGKSAQIPLHVWLPDAMAGPTPVSALIHAATMVTAGVYLVARLHGIYEHAPEASQVVAVIGAMTAFFAASIALVQTDIKKVLAYSTVSQLGFMFVALGVGAYGVAVFHVYTHAFFKACLFLGAGSVIHALGGEQDIRKMGGLARKIPVTFATFAIATAAIAGIPPLAGFFSKDEILWFAFASEHGGSPLLWLVGSVTALMTSFYMFRLLWLTFLSPSRMSHEVEHHVHESPFSMTSALIILAVLSAIGGFFELPHFLEPVLPLAVARESLEHYEHLLVGIAIVIGLAGFVAATLLYRNGLAKGDALAARFPRLHKLLGGKYWIDELYEAVLGRPLHWVSERVFLDVGDRFLIDGTLNGLAEMTRRAAGRLGRIETGQLQWYVAMAVLGIVGSLAWVWRHV
ncbi:MAG TPA: NADH-quinone oxidoreductase subunit L [Steroidobacteraceae bacterium]